jgi:uncharacterized membrane protein
MFKFIRRFRNVLTRSFLYGDFAYLLSSPLFFSLVFLAGFLWLYSYFTQLINTIPFGIRFFFDYSDLSVYFQSGRWAVGQGTLYKDVFSEYPFLANIIFGIFRFLASFIQPFLYKLHNFWWLWMSVAWFIYIWILYQVTTKISKQALWIWLAPAPLYFTFLRFDIYPAVMTLLALLAIRREKDSQGAFWLGIAIALKGYALFVLPSYFVYLYSRKGFLTSCKIIAICLAPLIFSNLVVFAYSGLEGFLQPYAFHIDRRLNEESSYDAIIYLFNFEFLRDFLDFPKISRYLQIAVALLAAWLQPKRFQDLIDAFLLAIVGFTSFSTFYSPQFVLWIAAVACFSRSRWIILFSIILSWLTYIYFPVLFDIRRGNETNEVCQNLFKIIIILVTANRFALIYSSFQRLWKNRFKRYTVFS